MKGSVGQVRWTGSWCGSAGSVWEGGSVRQVRGGAPRDRFVGRAPWDRFVVALRDRFVVEGSAGQVRGGAPRDQSCARRERWDRRSFRAFALTGIRMSTFLRSLRTAPAAASWSRTGSVPPIYTKGDTLYYTDVVAGAPRDRSCARCGLVEAHGGSGQVRRSECPNGAPHTSPG